MSTNEIKPVMTEEQKIQEQNAAIAVFMGYERYEDNYGVWFKKDGLITCMHPKLEDLKYHSSWDALMEVVEKIESIQIEKHGKFAVYICSNSCTIQGTKFRPEHRDDVYFFDIYSTTKMHAIWLAVTQFIQWHNSYISSTDKKEKV